MTTRQRRDACRRTRANRRDGEVDDEIDVGGAAAHVRVGDRAARGCRRRHEIPRPLSKRLLLHGAIAGARIVLIFIERVRVGQYS
jgi:hypothetical protein